MSQGCLDYRVPTDVCTDSDRSNMEKYCSGCNVSVEGLSGRVFNGNNWEQANCSSVFFSLLFDSAGDYDSSQIFRVQEDVNNLFESWQNAGNQLQAPGSEGYSTFQQKLLRLCTDSNNTPGVCDNYLCNQVCPTLEYSDLADFWGQWCGCYVEPPENQRQLYADNIPPSAVTPNDQRGLFPCYPFCHRVNTVQLYDLSSGTPYRCSSNVCVIDQVSLESDLPVDVNIATICSQCLGSDATCRCIVTSDSEDLIDTAGGQLQFNTICGQNSICYLATDDGFLEPVDCTQLVDAPPPVTSTSIALIILIVIVIVAIILIGMWIIFRAIKPKEYKETRKLSNDLKNSTYDKGLTPTDYGRRLE